MDIKTFLDNFGVIANAPNGIQRLRETVLRLAISGQLLKSTYDGSYEIDWSCENLRLDVTKLWGLEHLDVSPANWAKVPMARLGNWGSGGTPKKGTSGYYGGNIPWLVIGDLNDGIVESAQTLITQKAIDESSASIVPPGAVLVAMYGSIGKSGITGIACATNQAIAHCVVDSGIVSAKYLLRIILGSRALLFSQSRGLAQQNISQTILKHMMIALPPVEEQERITTKVDELMSLCDELETQKNKRETLRTAVRAASFGAISTGTTPEELSTAWSRISKNWETIADSKQGIKALRQLVLDLAVRGLLGTGDESDGHASEFIREFGNVEICEVKNPPHAIPKNWRWVCFGDVSKNLDSQRIPLSKSDRELRQGPYDYYGASGVIDSIDDYIFEETLMLIGEDGANLINRSTPIAFLARGKYWVNNHAHVIGSINESALSYLALAINAMDLKPYVTGTAQPKLNQAKLNSIPVPVPPLAEQARIVLKVHQVMKVCDELEVDLAIRTQIETAFSDASTKLLSV